MDCPICFKHFEKGLLEIHINDCLDDTFTDKKITNRDIKYIVNIKDKTFREIYGEILTPIQYKALEYCFKKSAIHSKNTYMNVLIRFINLGYTEDDLKMVIKHVKNDTPLVIHVRLETVLEHMIIDNRYKNCFEVHGLDQGQYSARKVWEKNLFNSIYDDSSAVEKVKYGALNIFNEINGVTPASEYGSCFFILKDSVKNRTSFVYGDSSEQMIHLCTFSHSVALFNHIPDNMICHLINMIHHVENLQIVPYQYIEAQIHGPVRMKHDIKSFVINTKLNHITPLIRDRINDFSVAHGIPVIYVD